MKTLYIICSQIVTMIKQNVFIFIILCIGIFSCNIMFIYTYGNVIQFKEAFGTPDYYIYYNSGNKLTLSEIENEFSNYNLTTDYYTLINPDSNYNNLSGNMININNHLIRTRLDINFFRTIKGKSSNLQELNTILIPEEFNSYNVGDIININESYYKVIGVTVTPYFIMSIDTFVENELKPDMISIKLPNNTHKGFRATLYKLFNENYIIESPQNEGINNDVKLMLITSFIIYILCVFSLLFLITYIYDQSAYELNIYEILGATRKHIILILGSVMLIILSILCFISQYVHIIFYDTIFSKINIVDDFIYTYKDYIAIYFITIALVYIFVLIYIYIRVTKSAIVNSRKFIT